jgi:ribonuclease BN (tRNA processing enzyme)
MTSLDFQFVGTGNAFAPGGLCWNGFVLNGRYLFEAPPQALQALNSLKLNANDLDAVILSHHHGDHFLGLPFLILQWTYSHRGRPIRIVGPVGTRDLAHDVFEKVYPGLFDGRLEIEWDEVAAGGGTKLGDLELEAHPVMHDDRLSATLGFSAALGGRRFGYTGDSAMCEAVLDLGRHSEVLISECASRADKVPVHMNLVEDMPKLRAAMDPDATLLLTHLGANVDNDGLKNTTVARDFETYRF